MVDISRDILARFWIGKATIYGKSQYKDFLTKTTQVIETEICTDEPCRVSYSSKSSAAVSSTYSQADQEIILFISSDIDIPAGSKVLVTQIDQTTEYYASGFPRRYSSHQQITLKLKDDKA